MSGCCAAAFGSVALHARRFDPEATAKGRERRAGRNLACMPSLRSAPNPEPPERGRSGGLTPPPRPPAAALRRARPPPSDVGRAPHTALRAPPWAFTQHRACSHHPRNVSAHALSSPRGIGILAPAPRCDQRAGGRRTRRIPPHTHKPAHKRGTDAARLPSRQLSSSPVHPPSTIIARLPGRKSSPRTIISAAAPVEGGRVGNQRAAAAPPPPEPRGPGSPRGGR